MTIVSPVFPAMRVLYNLWSLDPAIAAADAVVLDGPSLSGDLRDTVAVGVSPPGSSATAAVTSQVAGPGGLMSSDAETYSIGCGCSCALGDGDHQAARDRIEALFGLCIAVVRRDMTLGGTVHLARLGSWSLWELATARGSELYIDFQIVGFTQL